MMRKYRDEDPAETAIAAVIAFVTVLLVAAVYLFKTAIFG